jgi:hypothetical protein
VKRPLVYVAGPYSKPDPCENTNRAILAANRLLDCCAPLIPHLSHFWHTVTPKPYEEWLALDLEYLRRCDVVLRLPGESSGADGEVAFALEHGIPVFHDEPALRAWIEAE